MKFRSITLIYVSCSLSIAGVVSVKAEDKACKIDLDCTKLRIGCCNDLAYSAVNKSFFQKLNFEQQSLCVKERRAKLKAKEKFTCKTPAAFHKPVKAVCQNNVCAMVPYVDLKK